ncbi:transporter [Salarchaeum sp. JOR-1]|uniref:transporter n=1 Tax=Salarchaeum sp. JOR-1 TaxID=2599399 RepID=UPI00119885FD|nr:transporter [Salarchaeum sp. JOR-1]QDX41748.1 transporter [Salarchaeum sp. JOR-1]
MTRLSIRGVVAGALTYTIGYAFAYATASGDIEDELAVLNFVLGVFGQDAVPTWTAVGWLAYSAMYVPLAYWNTTQNLLADANPLVHLVPGVLLALAGAGVARSGTARTPTAGARAGVTVALGFLPLVVLGAFAFTVTRGDLTVRPDPALAVAAGALYPLVFATAGGALASWLRGRAQPALPRN